MTEARSSDAPAADLVALVRENEALREEVARLRQAPPPPPPSLRPVDPDLASEREARLRMYEHFMVAPFAVAAFVGPEHVVEFANPMALRAWRKDRAVMRKPIADALPEIRDQPFIGYLDAVRATGTPYRGFSELARLERVAGGELEDAYFDFVYSPMRQRDGTIDGILMFSFDVTEQVAAHHERLRYIEETRLAEQLVRDVIDNLPDLAWTLDAEGRPDFFNLRWYEYTGIERGMGSPRGDEAIADPKVREQVMPRWIVGIASGSPFELEFPLHGADGTSRWFLTRVRPLHDAAGAIVRWVGTSTDIDDRKREESFRETFLGVIGHDLRNPLSAILTTSRLLAKRDASKPISAAPIERIIRSGVRMQRMIDQLLDLTRARIAGGIPLNRSAEPVALAPIVARIVDEIRGANPDRVIDVQVDETCAVRLDADRFEQVVSNLLGNAVLHGDPATAVLVKLEPERGHVSLHVQNGGAPIDPAFVPVLFNPFARNSRAPGAGSGLGLGLYISEQVVSAHGGNVSVTSTAETGTRFTVRLPSDAPPPA
jgi:PAS domain S-box-containing protein